MLVWKRHAIDDRLMKQFLGFSLDVMRCAGECLVNEVLYFLRDFHATQRKNLNTSALVRHTLAAPAYGLPCRMASAFTKAVLECWPQRPALALHILVYRVKRSLYTSKVIPDQITKVVIHISASGGDAEVLMQRAMDPNIPRLKDYMSRRDSAHTYWPSWFLIHHILHC